MSNRDTLLFGAAFLVAGAAIAADHHAAAPAPAPAAAALANDAALEFSPCSAFEPAPSAAPKTEFSPCAAFDPAPAPRAVAPAATPADLQSSPCSAFAPCAVAGQ